MKKRNLKLMIFALTVASFISSSVTVSAKPTKVEKTENNSSQQVNKNVKEINKANKNEKNYSKKAEKEVIIISHRLDKIEVSLKDVMKKLDVYLNVVQTGTTTSSAIDTSNTTSSSIQEDTSSDETTVDNSTETGTTTTQAIEETEDLSDDFENEYKEEDNGRYNSFYGKLNAITNRLNTVERQLRKISDSGNPEMANLNSRLASLREQIKTATDKLSTVEKQNVDKIKKKSSKKQMKEQKINQDKKTWKISFSKELKGDTVNPKNIMIVDSSNNLVDAGIYYDKSTNSVVVEAKDGFDKGETYFILIGDEVQSAEGEKLLTPVEQKFTVN